MNKPLVIIAVVVLLAIGGFFVLNSYIYNEKQGETGNQPSYKDIAYTIDGREVMLVDGYAEEEAAPGSASKITTRYFGNEAYGDLNGDGISDIAFLLTEESGGSGTFFYAVAAVKTDTGYTGTRAIFLGDRIAPQTTEVRNGEIIVNYAARKPNEPMTAQPSVGVSKYLKILNGELIEFEKNFEGEADPSRMTLNMKPWIWISALYNDGREIKPKQAGVFTLTFGTESRFSATTDCNSMSGNYTARDGTLSFSEIASTKKYCVGSQEQEFAALIMNTTRYHFTSRGELIVELKFDSGTATFR